MPRLPDVQSLGGRNVPSVNRPGLEAVPPEAIEQGVMGETLQAVGGQMQQASRRMFARQDAVDRARYLGEYNETIASEVRRLETEADLSKPETVAEFGGFLRQKQQEFLGQHKGSADSRAALAERMEGLRFKYAGEIAGRSVAAQRALVQSHMEAQTGEISSQVYDAPGGLQDAFDRFDAAVDDMAPGLSSEEERAYRVGGRAQIVASATDGLLDRGALDEAESLLTSTDLAQYVPPDALRRYRSRITVQRVNEERDRTELQRKQKQVEGFLGRSLNQTEKLSLVGLAPKPRAATTADKIREFESVTGRAATDAEVAKMYGAGSSETQDNPFGAGMTGRSMSMILDIAPMYESGLTSPEQERQLEAAMAALRVPDPITGMRVTEPPPFLANALRARGVDPQQAFDGQVSIVGAFGETPLEGAAAAPPPANGVAQAPAAEPTPAQAPQQQASGPADDGAEITPTPEGGLAVPQGTPTIWERAESLSGPVAAATEAGRRVPGISGLIDGGQTVRDRTFARNFQRGVVTALQQSPRYAEGEREAIANEVQILGSLIDTEANYQDKLVGLDEALQLRQQTAEQTAADRGQPADVRRDATAVANLVQQIRQTIGVPPLVNSRQEALQLPPGTVFRTPTGDVLVVPSNGG